VTKSGVLKHRSTSYLSFFLVDEANKVTQFFSTVRFDQLRKKEAIIEVPSLFLMYE